MITSPQTSITPQQSLARLTLATSAVEEKIRRKSTIGSGGRPSLGHIDGLPLSGPIGPPLDGPTNVFDNEAVQSPTTLDGPDLKAQTDLFSARTEHERGMTESREGTENILMDDVDMKATNDNSSEATLVSTPSIEDEVMVDVSSMEEQEQILEDKENKENFAPTKGDETLEGPPSPEKDTLPLSETSPSRLNAQAGADAIASASSPPKSDQNEKPAIEPAGRPPPIPPRPAPQSSIPSLEEYARQQDVTEVLSHSLFQLSCAIKPTSVDKEGNQMDQVQDLFFGKTKTHLLPDDPAHNTEDRFLSIIVRLVSRPHDIYAALDSYFDVDEIEGGSKRYTSISAPPPVFQIHLDRVGYDPVSKTAAKINHHVDLKETIYLDRYMETEIESPLMERRQQTWMWKKQLAAVNARREELTTKTAEPDVVSTLENAKMILMSLQQIPIADEENDLGISPTAITTLEALAEQTRAELNTLETRSTDLFRQADTNFTDLRTQAYRLHAAFFHRGTGTSGHYWIYIYDFKKEIWRKYNDGYVTEVKDTNEIFRSPTQADKNAWAGPPNPYFLVYVRDDIKDKLVESVHREITEPPRQLTPPVQGTSMVGGDLYMTDHSDTPGTSQLDHSASAIPWSSSQPQPAITAPALGGGLDLSGANHKIKW